MSYLTPSDVRAFMLDRMQRDNVYSGDIDFPEEDILVAMKLTCGEYNATPPPGIECLTATTIPGMDEDACFVKGVAAYLMRAVARSSMRNAITYTAGGVQTSPEVDLIKYYSATAPDLEKEFRTGAQMRRVIKNIRLGYGPVG